MKKILALALSLIMCLCFTACGNNEADNEAIVDGIASVNEAQNGEDVQNGNGQTTEGVTILKTTDIQEGEYYDFGLQVDLEYAAYSVMERIDESRFSEYTGEFENRMNALAKTVGDNWEVMCDYDDDPEYGKMLMADALKDGNVEDVFMQLGWYEDTENAESVYYTSYCSSDMSAFDQNLEQTTKDIEALFGVKVDIEKLKSASKDAFEKVIENEYYYIYEQDAKVTFEDYTETVALTMEVGYPEEDGGDMIGYVYCERARIYEL